MKLKKVYRGLEVYKGQITPYYFDFYVVYGARSFIDFLKDKLKQTDEVIESFPLESDGFVANRYYESTAINLMYLNSGCNIATMYHEALHMALLMMEDKGIPINEPNSEVIAYHQEELAAALLDFAEDK